ncbi:hypothetical protein COLO4_24785 [Corchorus olitorius]|uniref:Uncharacterized protein n=1 Tax=Corchorus olitorius TaxID=93759 RepID=A0A1R3I6T5_9ROSI|nr:hypothetical protein COLO4_24785 [Corchorus olitorius]
MKAFLGYPRENSQSFFFFFLVWMCEECERFLVFEMRSTWGAGNKAN